MNSIWNKNIALLKERFPSLAEIFQPAILENFSEQNKNERSSKIYSQNCNLKIPVEILPSKLRIQNTEDFFPTAKENGKYLHSAYNPVREAEQAAENIHKENPELFGTAFFGCGLGYNVISYARLFPNDTIILVENDENYFFTALSVLDWSDFFKSKNIVLAIKTAPDQVISIIEHCGGFNHIHIYENSAQTQHSKDYFSALKSLIERNKRKSQINNSTLEKFSGLWLKNSCRNLHHLAEKDGVNIYKGKLNPKIPALILAAGPTLEEALPILRELKKRTLLIAVDTALRPCLNAGVEPDFVILCDPQYYAYRHIAGLCSPSSVLITESAAYPPVFRFPCRKTVMCSSMFPLGQFVESKLGEKGVLSAGGSVSTTAWDFARLAGAKNIIFSGLDLGYPDYQTHIRGSTFEEKIHTISKRTNPAEKLGISALFAAGAEKSTDYTGAEILTDCKMKMFAWWFESKQEEFSSSGLASYSLSTKSLKIPGFKTLSINELLSLPDFTGLKNEFFIQSEKQEESEKKFGTEFESKHEKNEKDESGQNSRLSGKSEKFIKVLDMIKNGLNELHILAKKGIDISDKAISKQTGNYAGNYAGNQENYSKELEKIDSAILCSEFKDLAALVFPTEDQLSKIYEKTVLSADKLTATFQRSKIIYNELEKSIKNYRKNLSI